MTWEEHAKIVVQVVEIMQKLINYEQSKRDSKPSNSKP